MTRTPCTGAALACIIALWAAKIVAVLRAIVETVLAMAENIRNTLQQPGACWRKVALWQPVRSRPMMSRPGFLPPLASTSHVLACRRSSECGQAVMMDLCGTSEARMMCSSSTIEPGPARTQ